MFKGPIALGAIRTSFILGLRLFIQAGTLLLVALVLEPEKFGAFVGIASLAVLLGALSSLGLNWVLFGEISKKSTNRNQILSYAIPATILFGGLLFVAYLMLALWLLPDNKLPYKVLLVIGFTEVVLQPLFNLIGTEHHALGRIARAQAMQSLPLTLRLFTVAIIFFGDLTPAIDIYAFGYLMSSILALTIAWRSLPEKWPNCTNWRLPTIVEWRYGIGYAAINVSKLGPAELDKTLAIKLLPLEAAGIYAASARVIGAITLPVTAMMLSALPRLFRENVQNEVRAKKLLYLMYITAFVYGVVLAGAMWLFAPTLEILFGKKYEGMCEVIRWLSVAVPGMTLRLVIGNALVAMDKPWFRFFFEFIGMIILVIACFLLVPAIGDLGLPTGLVAAEWFMVVVGFIFIGLVNSKVSNK